MNEQAENQPIQTPRRPDLYQVDPHGQVALKGEGWKSFIYKPQSKDLPKMAPAVRGKRGEMSLGAQDLIRGGYRIPFLDTIRGVLVLAILFYRLFGAFYECGTFADTGFGTLVTGIMGSGASGYWIYGVQCLFVILSGVSINFSRKPRYRALVLAVGAVLVTLRSLPTGVIWFGYLHFLCIATLIYDARHRNRTLDNLFNKAGAAWTLSAFVVFIFLTGFLTYAPITVGGVTLPLFISGFTHEGFASPEFYGFFPWIFAYFTGVIVGRYLRDGLVAENTYKFRIAGLDALGRVALPVYILARPVCYGLAYLLGKIF